MKKMTMKDYLKYLNSIDVVYRKENGKLIFMQHSILKAKWNQGVIFKNGNHYDMRKENLELVDIVDLPPKIKYHLDVENDEIVYKRGY